MHRLAVEHGGDGTAILVVGSAHTSAQAIVECRPAAVAAPGAEVVIDGFPGRKVLGQEPPGAAAFDGIENGVEDQAKRGARASALLGLGQQGFHEQPLGVAAIGLIMRGFHRPNSATAKVGHPAQRPMSSANSQTGSEAPSDTISFTPVVPSANNSAHDGIERLSDVAAAI